MKYFMLSGSRTISISENSDSFIDMKILITIKMTTYEYFVSTVKILPRKIEYFEGV